MRGVYVGSLADDLAALKQRIEQGAQSSVERTVYVRGGIAVAGVLSAIGLIVVLSHLADR